MKKIEQYEQSLSKDYIWSSIGVLAQSMTSPLLLLIVARFHGEVGVGVFSYLFSFSIMLWLLNLWGGRTYQVADIGGKFSHQDYLLVRVILAIVVLLIYIVIGILSGFGVFEFTLLFFLTLFKIFEAIADTFYGVLQASNYLYIVGRSLFVKAVFGVLLFLVVDMLFQNMLLSTLSIALINLIWLIVYDFRLTNQLYKYNKSNLWQSICNSFTIMKKTYVICIVSVITTLTLNIPRIFLSQSHEDQLGQFGIISMAVTAAALVIVFIVQPYIRPISKYYFEKKMERINSIIIRILVIILVIGCITIVFVYFLGVPFLNVLFKIDFSASHLALIIITIGGLFGGLLSLFFNILIIFQKIRDLFIVMLSTTLILLVSSYFLVYSKGILGATMVYTICTFVQFVFSYMIFKRAIKTHIPHKE